MTVSPDMINGCFELAGAVALSANVARLLRDRSVKGVHWASTAFFSTWGFWNLFYYPSLHQWWSLAGGTAIVLVNALWLGLVYQIHKNRAQEKSQ